MPERLFSGRRKRARPSTRGGRAFPISIIAIAALLALFGLVTPLRLPLTINPASVSLPPPTTAPSPSPAPTDVHGGQIVFTCTRQQLNQICMIRADGTNYEQLTSGEHNSYYPAISPDGDHIIFAVNENDMFDLYRLAPGVKEGARSAESRSKRLTDYIGNVFSPSFSPDGKEVVFVNRTGEGPAALWRMRSDGQDAGPLYVPPNDVVGAAWSPSGRYIGFLMSSGRSFAYEVYLLDLLNLAQAPRRITSDLQDMGGSLSWAPDERNILVFAGPAAAREIYRLELDTGQATRLTFGGNNASPAYSPDGRLIVFNSLRNDGQADLYVMLADGHSQRQLTDHPEPDWQPQWGP